MAVPTIREPLCIAIPIIELDKLSIFLYSFVFKSIISKSPFEYPNNKEKLIVLKLLLIKIILLLFTPELLSAILSST